MLTDQTLFRVREAGFTVWFKDGSVDPDALISDLLDRIDEQESCDPDDYANMENQLANSEQENEDYRNAVRYAYDQAKKLDQRDLIVKTIVDTLEKVYD